MNTRFQVSDKKGRGFAGSSHSSRQVAVYVAISVLAHVLFFVAAIWFVQFEIHSPVPEVVQVDLVSFAPGEPGGGEQNLAEAPPAQEPVQQEQAADTDTAVVVPEKQPAQEIMEKPAEPAPVPTVKPDISLKTKPKNLQELMADQDKKPPAKKQNKPAPKSKPDPGKELEKARQKLADEMAAQKKEQLTQAMERIARAVKQQDTDTRTTSEEDGNGPIAGSGNAGGPGKKGVTPIDLYKMLLKTAIEQNWVFNETLAGMDQNIEARILIKILKNGEIRDIVYETRSGNRYLDQSAKRAIQRANPLPPLPKGMAAYDVVVIFTPKGLK